MQLTEIIVSTLLKKGVMYEARNVESDIELPDTNVKIKVKIDHMTLKFSKKDEEA